ncbi:helix-turn-helix domain-containing protein [Halorussus litoreus]|uniref:helix-turn-helix domain-containing protein n=1 Tax=Halorussus litoreus TaxID=1710536 RepID=UPI000E24AF7C|nr:helix-turn-helix domain-containing protein [Halorussus litoreus]
MSVLAELTVPAAEFVLTETLTSVSGMRIEIKRVVAGSDRVTPYFWVAEADFDDFEAALRGDPTVEDMVMMEEQTDDERFYRVVWRADSANLITAVSETRATIMEAVSENGDDWQVKSLFPDRDALSKFHDYCVSHDFSFTLDRVYTADNSQEEGEYDVTSDQREALVGAYHAGYFDVPRGITLTELAEELGISRNALSARLRRGQRNLLSNTLVHDE